MKGLDQSILDDLLANSRTRNQYGPKIVEFDNSDEAAIDVQEAWPEFAGKKASTLYQGFNLAIKKAEVGDTILLKQNNEHVYLLHKERVALAVANANVNGDTQL